MALWPETDPTPVYPFKVFPVFDTDVQTFGGGVEQRRSNNPFPVFNVDVKYKGLTLAEIQTLFSFHLARKGSFEDFFIYDLALLESTTFSAGELFVATADGLTGIFDLPGRNTSGHTIYLNGVAQSTPGDYSILTGGGEGNADRVEFVSDPDEGDIISCDLTGYLRYKVRFKSDDFERNLYSHGRYQNETTISLKGVM